MKRRDAIKTLPILTLPTISGCSGSSGAPEIEIVEMIAEWNSFGDVEDNSVSTISVGQPVYVGARYDYYSEDGKLEMAIEATFFGPNDNSGTLQGSSSRLVEEGWSEREYAMPVETFGWAEGEHVVEVLIRDVDSEETSTIESDTFDVV